MLFLELHSVVLFPSPLKAASGLKNIKTIELEGLLSLVLLSVEVLWLLLLSL